MGKGKKGMPVDLPVTLSLSPILSLPHGILVDIEMNESFTRENGRRGKIKTNDTFHQGKAGLLQSGCEQESCCV